MEIQSPHPAVTNMPTGIRGFDEITDGGLPRARTSLVMGRPGCGKTVFAVQTLVDGARQRTEAGGFGARGDRSRRASQDALRRRRRSRSQEKRREARRQEEPRAQGAVDEMAKVSAKKGWLRLRLYTSGDAPNSLRAIANTKAICAEHFTSRYELEIVDMMNQPERAMADGVIVTPTLLRLSPLPIRRIIGNLSDTSRVLLALRGE